MSDRVVVIDWPGYFPKKLLLVFGSKVPRDRVIAVLKTDFDDDGKYAAVLRPDPNASFTHLLCGMVPLIWFRDERPSVGVVAHEVFHAVHDVLPSLGIPYTKSDEMHEVYGYAVGSVTVAIMRLIQELV